MWEQLKNTVWTWLTTAGIDLIIALAVLIIGVILIKIAAKIIIKLLSKTKMPKASYKFIVRVIKFVLYLLLLLVVCQMIGIPTTAFVAISTAASLAISLSLQDSISNLANGVVIISTQPFKEGDFISVNGLEGTVKEIRMLHTIITTVDNKQVSIPNSTIVQNELTDYSANPTRKVIFNFSVDYATDIEKAKQIILNVIKNCDKALLEPEPFCALKTMDSSSLGIVANCWCLTQDYWSVYYEVMDNVFNEFKREGINIPFNQLEVRLRDDTVVMPYKKDAITPRNPDAPVKYVEPTQDTFIKVVGKLTHKKKNKKTLEDQIEEQPQEQTETNQEQTNTNQQIEPVPQNKTDKK